MASDETRKAAHLLFRAIQRIFKSKRIKIVGSGDRPKNQYGRIYGHYDSDAKAAIIYPYNHWNGENLAKTLLHEQIHAVCDPFNGEASEALVSALERFLHPPLPPQDWKRLGILGRKKRGG